MSSSVRFCLQLQVKISQCVDLKAVFLISIIVKFLQLVNSKLMKFIKIMPPFVSASELCVQLCIGNVTAHGGGHIESTHGQYIDAVAGDGPEGCRDTLHHACVDMRTLAGGNVNSHTGSTEKKGSFKLAFGNLASDAKSHSVEHSLGSIGITF